MAKSPPKKEEPKARPVMSFGPYPTDRATSIESACWRNMVSVGEGDDQREIATFNVTLKRSYRDAKGNWNPNQNFRPHDIPVVVHALQKAYDWILENRNAEPEE